MSQHFLIPAGFCTTGLKRYTGKYLEQEADYEAATSAADQSPAGVTERGKDVLGQLFVAWTWVMGVWCWQCRRAGLTGIPQDPCPPSFLPSLPTARGGVAARWAQPLSRDSSAQHWLLCWSSPCSVTLVWLCSYSDKNPLLQMKIIYLMLD